MPKNLEVYPKASNFATNKPTGKRKAADPKKPVIKYKIHRKGRQFFLLHQQTNQQILRFNPKMVLMTQRFTEKVTRERLRSLQNGETLTVQCADGYDLASQRNTAYAMGKLENCRFACTADGLKLTVTRYDTD